MAIENLVTRLNKQYLDSLRQVETDLNTEEYQEFQALMDWLYEEWYSETLEEIINKHTTSNKGYYYRGDILPLEDLVVGNTIPLEYGSSFSKSEEVADEFLIKKIDEAVDYGLLTHEGGDRVPVLCRVRDLYGLPLSKLTVESGMLTTFLTELEVKAKGEFVIEEVVEVHHPDTDIPIYEVNLRQEIQNINSDDYTFPRFETLNQLVDYVGYCTIVYENDNCQLCGDATASLDCRYSDKLNTDSLDLGCLNLDCSYSNKLFETLTQLSQL